MKPCNPDADRGNWNAEASGHGYNARWADDSGWKRGRGAYTAEGGDATLYNKMPDESVDAPHERLAGLIDGQNDQPAGELLGGGGPVSDNKQGGVGAGPPRYAPKTGPQSNARRR